MAGIVLEGGAFRGMFSAGALDALLDEGLMFPYVIGVSSGCSYGCSYVSRQRGRSWKISEYFSYDKNYVNIKNYLAYKSLINVNLTFRDVPNQKFPFDYETFYNCSERFITVACDASNLKTLYYEKDKIDRGGRLMQGSCALPPFIPSVVFEGKTLLDGGLGDPIPLTRSEKDGNKSNLVILTKPHGYRHHFRWDEKLLSAYYMTKSANASGWMKIRHNHFNNIFERCEREDGNGNIVSLFVAPDRMIARFENDFDKLKALYDNGYESVMSRLDEIKDIIKQK